VIGLLTLALGLGLLISAALWFVLVWPRVRDRLEPPAEETAPPDP
jgi:hypothetical protein